MATDLKQLSLDQIKKIVKKEEKALKKEYSELAEKKKLIERYKKIRKARQKVRGQITIKKSKPKSVPNRLFGSLHHMPHLALSCDNSLASLDLESSLAVHHQRLCQSLFDEYLRG